MFSLAADPLSGAVNWLLYRDVDVAVMESVMSYRIGSFGVVRSVVCVLIYFILWGDTRSLCMPVLRPSSQAGPVHNPSDGTSVVKHNTIRLA